MAIPSFIFGGDAAAKTPQELAQQRAIIHALMSSPRAPKNVGEGLNALGDGIVANVLNRRANAAETAGQESAAAAFNPLVGALTGFPAAPSSSRSTAGPQVSASPPANPNVGSTIDFARAESEAPSPLAFTGVSQAGSGFTTVQTGDGRTVRRVGSRNWRNNNPGNIEYGDFAKKMGAVGSDGRFAVFPTLEAGRAAKERLLFDSPNYRDKTLAQAISRWAPPSENNTASYYTQLAQAAGVDPNTRMADLTPEQRQAVLAQMDVVEGFRPGKEEIIGAPAASALSAMATGGDIPEAPQVASLDPSIGMAQTRQVPLSPGQPVSASPEAQRVISTLTAPQSMTGGAPMGMQQVAQAAPQPDLDKIPVMAGGNAGALPPGAQSGPSLAQLLAAGSNPWLNETQSAIVKALLGQKLKEMDPNTALETEYKRAQIDHLKNPNARDKFGNSVIWGQDADGNWVAMQPSSGGGLVAAQIPDGIKLSPPGMSNLNLGTEYGMRDRNGQVINTVPIDNAGKARDAAAGKAQGEAAFDLPRVEQNAQQTLDVLERMKNHPGRAGSTGFIEGMLPSRTADQVDFQSLVDQTQGQTFLQAFQMLKGGGQITDIEGKKATDAISRLRNQRLSDEDYLRAINDLEDVVRTGLDRARKQAGQGSAAPAGDGGVVDYRDYFGGQ